jgi:hypothetical protein
VQITVIRGPLVDGYEQASSDQFVTLTLVRDTPLPPAARAE